MDVPASVFCSHPMSSLRFQHSGARADDAGRDLVHSIFTPSVFQNLFGDYIDILRNIFEYFYWVFELVLFERSN